MDTNDQMFFGKKLKVLREENYLSQKDVAQKLRTSQRSIQNYEKGERPISSIVLVGMLEIFQIDANSLFLPWSEFIKKIRPEKTDLQFANVNLLEDEPKEEVAIREGSRCIKELKELLVSNILNARSQFLEKGGRASHFLHEENDGKVTISITV